MSLSKNAQVVLDDLKKNGAQAAWDWLADLRFAKKIGATQEVKDLQKILRSEAPDCLVIIAHSVLIRPLKRKRLRALQELVRMGYVDAGWHGTGPGGRSRFGVGRDRSYVLRKEYTSSPSKPKKPLES